MRTGWLLLIAANALLAAEPSAELPVWRCLGCYWVVDGHEQSTIDLAYRPVGQATWRQGPPLFRVERGVKPGDHEPTVAVLAGATLWAGSVIDVAPGTAYELRLTRRDADGAVTERLLTTSTVAEPQAPVDQRVRHVVPGAGGGTGTAADPWRGLAAAEASARPGDLFKLHAGVYPGVFDVAHSGQPGRPIIWQAAGDGPAIIDAGVGAADRPGRAVAASDSHDVWFEGLEIRGAAFGLVGHDASRLVVRRCWFHQVDFAITCTRNDRDQVRGWFISDNLMEGPCTWPRSKGIEDPRAVQVTGTAMTVCHNRIRGFGDGIDTFPSPRVENIEFCYNEISECTDDGIEMDYSTRNTRCFANRITNCFDGVSVQPVYGGPVYISRNVLFNLDAFGPFKMHNSPSGALFIHNTAWRRGAAAESLTNERVRRVVWRNNLLLGTTGNYAFEALPVMEDCDFDYDGYGGGPWRLFLKWNGRRYATFGEVVATAPVERHAVQIAGNPFASGLSLPPTMATQVDPRTVDARLRADSNAIDAGQPLPGFGDRVTGRAPDLGAIEFGGPLPPYGPRTAR